MKFQAPRNRTRLTVASLLFAALLALVAACSSNTPTTTPPTAAAVVQPTKAAAAAVPAAQRADMYKALPPMTIDANKKYQATIQTAKGNIVVDLYPKDAPQHVNSFVFLARQGFYDGLTFHRVVKEPQPFVIQGGDPLGTGTGGPGYNIPPEISRKHLRGSLAMARTSGPPETTPSSGSQFYIALTDLPFLDGMYTAFGQTTPDTISVIDKIEMGDVIKTITITEQ